MSNLQSAMLQIYNKIKTPYKYGAVTQKNIWMHILYKIFTEDEETVFYDNAEVMNDKKLKDYLYKERKLC